MSIDEGYIKFKAHWQKSPPLNIDPLEDLVHWRQQCYEQKFIGAYDNGIGYGNISHRKDDSDNFYISGSATGNFPMLDANHFSEVYRVDASSNKLWCKGPIIASSESMSHAIIYELLPWVNAVIHIHHIEMWEKLLYKVPTTDGAAEYGSPEMVASIAELIKSTDAVGQQIIVMKGHEEGIFAYGKGLKQAFGILKNNLKKLK